MRVLIRHEMSAAEFAEISRQAYIDAAYDHYRIPGRKMTYARASVLTGVHRKEVVRLVQLRKTGKDVAPQSPNRTGRVLKGWLNDPDFRTAAGKPAVLKLHGDAKSFEALVNRYSGDITQGAVLDELVRLGIAERGRNHTVKLLASGYLPSHDHLEQFRLLGVCATDLLTTGAHNTEQDAENRLFQRQFAHVRVPAPLADEFAALAQEKSDALLQELYRFLNERLDGERQTTEACRRVGLGIYQIDQPTNPEKNA